MSKKLTVKNALGHKVNAQLHLNPNESEVLVPATMNIGDNVHICKGTIFACNHSLPSNTIIGGYYEVKWLCESEDEVECIKIAFNPNGENPYMDNGDAAWVLEK